jgi:hypothetical protein
MNASPKRKGITDFEQFGYQTMMQVGDANRAAPICALELSAHAKERDREIVNLNAQIEHKKQCHRALHAHLYDRQPAVSDARMLTHSKEVHSLRTWSMLTSLASLAGVAATFFLYGWTAAGAVGIAALIALVLAASGKLGYEDVMAHHRGLQKALSCAAVALALASLIKIGMSRGLAVDQTAATHPAGPYVDGDSAPQVVEAAPKPPENTEAKAFGTLGTALLLFSVAADLALLLLSGKLSTLQRDEDYAAWREVKAIGQMLIRLEDQVTELLTCIETAQQRCAAGILRAQNELGKRRPPYHRLLTAFFVVVLLGYSAKAQSFEHYEGILIDVSGSISKSNGSNDLFREYLTSTRQLLLTEPAKSRVWVSSITVNSFSNVREIVKGWTPEARGVFTGNLDSARHELAAAFEKQSSGLQPIAAGTDIFGGLAYLKAHFESGVQSSRVTKTIIIFSDMMNETREFNMPELLALGTDHMMERVKANGLLLDLKGYQIRIDGASPNGLTPQGWVTVKNFWTMYFAAAGAELVSYSAECDVQR